MKRERQREREMEEKEEKHLFYIIWLCSLYYFIELYIKIKTGMLGVYNIINQMFKFQNFVIKLMHKK